MNEKTIAIIAGLGIAVLLFKPDLLSNLLGKPKQMQGGGGGGDTIAIIPPVVTRPFTYYDVTVGAPTFPDASLDPFAANVGAAAGGGYGRSSHVGNGGHGYTRQEVKEFIATPQEDLTAGQQELQSNLSDILGGLL